MIFWPRRWQDRVITITTYYNWRVLSSVLELGLVTWILGPSFFETMPNKIERIFQLINRRSKYRFVDVTKTNNFSENLFQGQAWLAERAASAVQLVENDGKTEKSRNRHWSWIYSFSTKVRTKWRVVYLVWQHGFWFFFFPFIAKLYPIVCSTVPDCNKG